MLRIRYFEEKVQELHDSNAIVGSTHLCCGQEAIPVGAREALRPDDPVFATYRGHGWAIASGVPIDGLFAELLGRQSGICGGRAGSAYLTAPDHGFYGENSIVGAGAPIATGAALAARFQGSGRVALSVFGDGAMNQGAVHEALNFASVFELPIVFVCENNGYSELTPIASMVRTTRLCERASAYGMPGVQVDGNDVVAVREAVREAADAARSGGGAALVEAMTQRIVGHYIGDAQQYRAPGELAEALADEPIARLRRLLETEGGDQVLAIDREVQEEVAAAAERALSAPLSDPAEVREGVYA